MAPRPPSLRTRYAPPGAPTLEAHAKKNSIVLTKVLALLRTRVKAIPDVEVSNEFQGVVQWFGEAVELLALNDGPTATPETKQIVSHINQAEVLNGQLHELTYGARWKATKDGLTAAKKAKLLDDMAKAKAKIAPLAEQLGVDVIDNIPDPVKQRIVTVLRDLTSRGNDLDRRRGEAEQLAVVAG